jgi:uncharacterized membrane protein YcaP (DUF421 family)
LSFLQEVFTADWFIELYEHVPVLAVRTLITFLTVLVVVRWTGKRSIANLAPFDMAMVIMIGEVAAIPVSELHVDLLHGVLPVLLIGGLHVLITTIGLYSKWFERLIEGTPTLLVQDGRVLTKNLVKERVSMSDLLTAMRHKEVTDVSQVKEAWIEHAGGVSVIRKKEADKVTPPSLQQALDQAIAEIVQRGAATMRREISEMLRGMTYPSDGPFPATEEEPGAGTGKPPVEPWEVPTRRPDPAERPGIKPWVVPTRRPDPAERPGKG